MPSQRSDGASEVSRRNPPPTGIMRLGDAAKAAGVSVAQLQYYLMLGLVAPAGRSSGRQRLFNPHCIKRIRMIRLLNESGYSLRDIREIFAGSSVAKS